MIKGIKFTVLFLLLFTLLGCEKVFDMFDDPAKRLPVDLSKKNTLISYAYTEDVLLDTVDYLNAGEERWFELDVKGGEIYNLEWEDDILENYSHKSIFISVYHENKTDSYFERVRMIQMNGSDKTIIPATDEKIYIKIEGFYPTLYGDYRFKVAHLQFDETNSYNTNVMDTVTVEAGETKIFLINAYGASGNILKLNRLEEHYLYGGTAIAVNAHCYFKSSDNTIFEGHYCMDESFYLTPPCNGLYYIILNGAHWWTEADVQIGLNQ